MPSHDNGFTLSLPLAHRRQWWSIRCHFGVFYLALQCYIFFLNLSTLFIQYYFMHKVPHNGTDNQISGVWLMTCISYKPFPPPSNSLKKIQSPYGQVVFNSRTHSVFPKSCLLKYVWLKCRYCSSQSFDNKSLMKFQMQIYFEKCLLK